MPKRSQGRQTLSVSQYEAKRAQILEAAKRLFIKHGYRGVAMRSLAREIGMSPMSLYRYFDNKRAILTHIWADVFKRVFTRCRAAITPEMRPLQGLQAYAAMFVEYWLAHRDHYHMIYGEIDTPAKAERFFAESEMVREEMNFIQALLEQAGIPAAQSELARLQYLCILHGVSHSMVTIPELNWPSPDQLVSGLVSGLVAQG